MKWLRGGAKPRTRWSFRSVSHSPDSLKRPETLGQNLQNRRNSTSENGKPTSGEFRGSSAK
jgi:hypothetical protein